MVELRFASSEISDDEVGTIFSPLALGDGPLNLLSLYLGGNNNNGIIGYHALAALLGNKKSMLKDQRNSIGDEEIGILGSALASNPKSKLNALDMEGNFDITTKGWQTFLLFLCDTSSISRTYFSNHMRSKKFSDLDPVLVLNQVLSRDINKKLVAYIMEPFATMTMEWEEWSVLPYILAFMSKAHCNTDGHSALYHFLGRMMSLFYAGPNVAKSEMKGPRRM